MKTIYDASLAEILPGSLSGDSQFKAIAQALDPLIKSVAKQSNLTIHLPRLDELSGIVLDVLADQLHVDFFDSVNLSDNQKKNLIRQSVAHHRRKGTVAAVEDVARQFFSNPQVVDDLGGFLFSLKTNHYTATPAAFDTFVQMLFDAKNVRSWLAGIDMDYSPPQTQIHIGNPQSTVGFVNVDTLKPKDSSASIYAGNLLVSGGSLTVETLKPKDSSICVKVGAPLVVNGFILFDSNDQPILKHIRENPTADLAMTNYFIARASYLTVPPEFDLLRILFTFPNGMTRRMLHIRNPRDNVTKAEIKAVADYAVDHDLVLGRFGLTSDDAPRATLSATKIIRII